VGASYFIVLEREIENFDLSMDGKMLCRASEALDAVATQHKVRPLTGFTSIDPAAAEDFLREEGLDTQELKLPPLQQFSAEDGLTSVHAILAHLQMQPQSIRNAEGVLRDLVDCERILLAARQYDVRWHFEVDF